MGADFSHQAGVIKRLVGAIIALQPDIDVCVARRLAVVRLHVLVK